MTTQHGRGQFPPRGGSPPRGNFPPQQLPALPSGYLAKGYFDEKGNILTEVVIEWASAIAKQLDSAGLQPTQLRKFFTEARLIQGQFEAGKSFDSLRGRILKLDAYAADAIKKGNAPQLFKQFIEYNLKWAAKDKKSFLEGFLPHFENIVAYFPRK